MYKDKAKQREAVKKATQRYRANKGDSALLGSKDDSKDARGLPVVDEVGDTQPVIPLNVILKTEFGNIRVSKPGDADYVPQCETTRAFIEDRPKMPETDKRGKDIKCFADLPPDVQRTIERVSRINNNEAEYKTEKAKRTARAIHYQSLFPDRYYSTGTGI